MEKRLASGKVQITANKKNPNLSHQWLISYTVDSHNKECMNNGNLTATKSNTEVPILENEAPPKTDLPHLQPYWGKVEN